eukprot:3061325-Ditylum_brightwellii.AAC.1
MVCKNLLNGGGGWVIWVELSVYKEGGVILCFGHWPGIMFSGVDCFGKQGEQRILLMNVH